MADRLPTGGWYAKRPGLTVLAALATLLGLLIVLPYLQYVLLGVVLAYILRPVQRWLERYTGSLVAALTLVAVAILAILLPLTYVLIVAFREALQVITAIQNGQLDIEAIESQIEATGYSVDVVEFYQTYQEPIATGLQGLAMSALEIAGGIPGILIGLTVTLFVLFALLRDGGEFVEWLMRVLPVEDELVSELVTELDQLMWASVVGNVAVAAIQAVLLGIGLALLGVPTVVLLSVVTFIFALLPLIGAFGVWVPVSLYLLATGQFVTAGILVVYGSIVSASDTYIRPALIGRTSAFNSAIIVVGIFGGLVVFGAVGLFIGPVVLGGAKITLDLFARERAAGVEPVTGAGRPGKDEAVQTVGAGVGTDRHGGGDNRDGPESDGDHETRDTDESDANTDETSDTDQTGDASEPNEAREPNNTQTDGSAADDDSDSSTQ